ncbi:hypothetical protein SAMN05414139_00533 [Burkholderia sp. D7]|nr:hypothetical protein SAMN05414139_00533 [Burkholderia sp. D7]
MPPERVASPFCLVASVCCFYVAALFGPAARLVGVVYDPVERIFRLSAFCLCVLSRARRAFTWAVGRSLGVYSRLDERVPFTYAREKLGPFVHAEIVVDFLQLDQQFDDLRIVCIDL